MDQKRGSDRVRTLRPAKAVWDNSRQAANLTIKDLSQSGAMVEVKELLPVPDSFDLMLLPSKEMRPVQVMRRAGQTLGLKFLDVMDQVAMDGTNVSLAYDVRTGENPIFGPVPGRVRALMPWAS